MKSEGREYCSRRDCNAILDIRGICVSPVCGNGIIIMIIIFIWPARSYSRIDNSLGVETSLGGTSLALPLERLAVSQPHCPACGYWTFLTAAAAAAVSGSVPTRDARHCCTQTNNILYDSKRRVERNIFEKKKPGDLQTGLIIVFIYDFLFFFFTTNYCCLLVLRRRVILTISERVFFMLTK